MKSFSDTNKMNGTKGFRPDEHPAATSENPVRGKGAPKDSASGIQNPQGDNPGANCKR